MKPFEPLTDLQWQIIEPLFPAPLKRGRGKPHTPWRTVLNSILFVLLTGAKWGALPQSPEFASKSASHRWFIAWKENGFLDQILATLKELSGLVSDVSFPARRNRSSQLSAEPILSR